MPEHLSSYRSLISTINVVVDVLSVQSSSVIRITLTTFFHASLFFEVI